MQDLELEQVGTDRLAALEVQDRGDRAGRLGRLDLGDGPANPDRVGAFAAHPDKDGRHLERDAPGVGRIDRADVREVDQRAVVGLAGPEHARAARDEDGEEAAGEPARTRARQVEVALAVPGEEAIAGEVSGAPEPEQHVVVAIEDSLHRGRSFHVAASMLQLDIVAGPLSNCMPTRDRGARNERGATRNAYALEPIGRRARVRYDDRARGHGRYSRRHARHRRQDRRHRLARSGRSRSSSPATTC